MEDIDNLPQRPIIPLHSHLDYKIKHVPFKRAFDIFFSLTCLILGSPFFLLIALFVLLTSPGKIVYSHERIGRGGKPFLCYKFRTMYKDADQRLKDILNANPEWRKEWERSYKLKKDPRITPFGSFLRKTSLDELPQFWNVLKGDLSVVGPRPVVKAEVEKYLGVKAYKILSIRPGLTGPWQVSGRSDITCYQTRVQLDEYYVDHHSILLDLKLIAKTIPAMLFSKGAY
ncbi:exopolysaccharide biosynthesis protein [Candidatus Protochlamydia naegleriophila]|uniref:Exopolysaccharide biosynthesis protein n=1 Tax=Candidatus Protochlamydia naegleriophila TaxID=389348 RepID=A0A0U5EQX6_9BACT|nr:sugar transferase [Candidatus Protochlamydia naegleriophila]CUI16563.1 exopolysaccharide biosynthesis protein [Candidatus Protochlamydia naegleriophila]